MTTGGFADRIRRLGSEAGGRRFETGCPLCHGTGFVADPEAAREAEPLARGGEPLSYDWVQRCPRGCLPPPKRHAE